MTERRLSHSDLERLKRSLRVSRLLAWGVVVVCALMAWVMVHAAIVAWSLGEWGTLAMGIGGLVVVVGLATLTLGLVRRQRQILEAGETLVQLQAPGLGDEPGSR